MTEETVPQPAPEPARQSGSKSPVGSRRFRIGALIVLGLAIGVILWLVLRDNGNSSSAPKGQVSAASETNLRNLAAQLGHPIYWVGPQPGYTYELTRQPSGTVLVRYLPAGAKIGSKSPYLSVATYPFPGAYAAIQRVARKPGVNSFRVAGGGLAEVSTKNPQDVHVAYPGVDYQLEVYDPSPGSAIALTRTGKLEALGSVKPATTTAPAAPKPVAASLATLKALPQSVGHPVYWVGARQGVTYELTNGPNGKVIVRYLPQGVAAGTAKPYLAVGTYPFPGALKAIQRLATQKNNEAIHLPGGGLAVVTKSSPSSIHLAFPNSDVQVEVYDPSASLARQLVSSGKVTTLG